jgi:hypothetical protein
MLQLHLPIDYQALAQRAWQLSDLLNRAAGTKIYTTVTVHSKRLEELAVVKGWAGGEPANAATSRAPYIGPGKLAEILLTTVAAPLSRVRLSPAEGRILTTGFPGGLIMPGPNDTIYGVSSSAWAGTCDLQHASLIMWSMFNSVRLHHVGFGRPTIEDMHTAVRVASLRYNSQPIHLPVDDHDRWFIWMPENYYIEEQHGAGRRLRNIHWDVQVDDPKGLLQFIQRCVGEAAELSYWGHENGEDPEGVVWVMDREDMPKGIMARRTWWTVR